MKNNCGLPVQLSRVAGLLIKEDPIFFYNTTYVPLAKLVSFMSTTHPENRLNVCVTPCIQCLREFTLTSIVLGNVKGEYYF